MRMGQSSISMHLWSPSFSQLLLLLDFLFCLSHLQLDSFTCPQYLALQIEATPLFWIVLIEHSLKSRYYTLDVHPAFPRWGNVKNLACFIHSEAMRGQVVGGRTSRRSSLFCILLRSGGLFVRFCECATDNPSPGYDDLKNDPVCLTQALVIANIFERGESTMYTPAANRGRIRRYHRDVTDGRWGSHVSWFVE